jgi:hypothetical protein
MIGLDLAHPYHLSVAVALPPLVELEPQEPGVDISYAQLE